MPAAIRIGGAPIACKGAGRIGDAAFPANDMSASAMQLYRIVFAALALVVGGQARAEIVSGNAVNAARRLGAAERHGVLGKRHLYHGHRRLRGGCQCRGLFLAHPDVVNYAIVETASATRRSSFISARSTGGAKRTSRSRSSGYSGGSCSCHDRRWLAATLINA